jgi:hypothetical protein
LSILLDGTLGITTPGLTNTGTETIVNLTTTGNTILGDASTDTLNVGNGGLIKDASGNVGIGDTSPAAYGSFRTLSVKGTTTSAGGLIDLKTSDNASILQIYNTNALAVINQSSNLPLAFNTNSTERMRLDSSGNLGLGVTPSAWNSSLKALQIQTTGIAANNGSFANFSYNTYYDSVGYKYQISAAALMYQQNNSSGHIWYTAPSGTAGNAITFTQAMTLDASSNLTVAARGAVASGSSSSPSHGLRITGSGNTSSNNGGFFNVRMVTLNGDGGSNSGNTFVSNLYGAKGVCIAAFNSSGDSVSPSTYCANSNLCTFVALVSS